MSKISKVQIRPSVSVEVSLILEELAKNKNTHLGKVLEELLEESDTYRKAREALRKAFERLN